MAVGGKLEEVANFQRRCWKAADGLARKGGGRASPMVGMEG